jgi:hypothetical protein
VLDLKLEINVSKVVETIFSYTDLALRFPVRSLGMIQSGEFADPLFTTHRETALRMLITTTVTFPSAREQGQ